MVEVMHVIRLYGCRLKKKRHIMDLGCQKHKKKRRAVADGSVLQRLLWLAVSCFIKLLVLNTTQYNIITPIFLKYMTLTVK